MELEVQRLKEAKPGWFKRHLNWTLIIAWLSGIFIIAASLVFYGGMNSEAGNIALRVVFSVGWVGPILINGWVLRQKGRNSSWLWWVLVGGTLFLISSLYQLWLWWVLAGGTLIVTITLLLKNNKSNQGS